MPEALIKRKRRGRLRRATDGVRSILCSWSPAAASRPADFCRWRRSSPRLLLRNDDFRDRLRRADARRSSGSRGGGSGLLLEGGYRCPLGADSGEPTSKSASGLALFFVRPATGRPTWEEPTDPRMTQEISRGSRESGAVLRKPPRQESLRPRKQFWAHQPRNDSSSDSRTPSAYRPHALRSGERAMLA